MTERELHKLLEIQYLKGRLDELHKAIPTVTDLDRSRKLDQRLDKYYNKLKAIDEVAYHLYQVEHTNQSISKKKSKEYMRNLLTQVSSHIDNEELIIELQKQISKY
jgi:hypothetical protein